MLMECSKCSYQVSVEPGERARPWCSRCGADLKAAVPMLALAGAVARNQSHENRAEALPPSVRHHECLEAPEDGRLPLPPGPALSSVDAAAESDVAHEVFRTKLVWQMAAWGCLVVCLGIAAVAASQIIHPPHGKVQVGAYGVLGLFGIGALLSAYLAFRFAGQKFEVSPGGLVVWQHFRPTSIAWAQTRAVYQALHPAWTKFRIVTRAGDFALNGEIQNHKQLGNVISERVASMLLPGAWQEIEAGRDVHLGPLRVSSAGVTVDGEQQPWHRIGVLTLCLNPNPIKGSSSRVSAMTHVRIGDVRVEVGQIPNFRLFQELAGRLFQACAVQR